MQASIKDFIDNAWGPENFYPSIFNSTGFVMSSRAVLGSLSYVGSPNIRSVEDLTLKYFYDAMGSKRLFRETWFTSTAVCMFNLIETVMYLVIGVFTAILHDDERFFNLAKRSFVQLTVNITAAAVGFVGQFSPTYGGKLYVIAISNLLKLDSSILTHCSKAALEGVGTVSEGIARISGSNESFVREVFAEAQVAAALVATSIGG